MSKKGGYQIVNFKGIDLLTEELVIDGIWEQAGAIYGKTILASGIVIDDVAYNDAFVSAVLEADTSLTFVFAGYTIVVGADDSVTATLIEAEDEGELG